MTDADEMPWKKQWPISASRKAALAEVERLKSENAGLRGLVDMGHELHGEAEAEVRRLRLVLEWYADPGNSGTEVPGERAREALAQCVAGEVWRG